MYDNLIPVNPVVSVGVPSLLPIFLKIIIENFFFLYDIWNSHYPLLAILKYSYKTFLDPETREEADKILKLSHSAQIKKKKKNLEKYPKNKEHHGQGKNSQTQLTNLDPKTNSKYSNISMKNQNN